MDPPDLNTGLNRGDDANELSRAEQTRLVKRVTFRLIPLLFCCYVIAYIDRINVGFAKLQLQGVLGVDPAVFGRVYGLGAGLFFVGYFIFEVPSNLILNRVGARLWIARIMILWGLVSMAFMFMKGVTSFYVLRFLLGAAEAGFFPGVILYITFWYPPAERARIIALFAIGAIAAGVVGSPISGALLEMDGIGGLAGWQWLFFLEGLPAVLLGFVVLVALPDGPHNAGWLSPGEKKWITSRVALPAAAAGSPHHPLRDCFTSPVVWLLCLIYFLRNVGTYGYEMWLPTMVKGITGKTDSIVGLINGLPYLVAGVAMYLVGRSSDRTGERRGHMAGGAIGATIGFVMAATAEHPVMAILGLAIAFAGSKASLPPFWALSTQFLKGTAAVGGIALINSIGNLGGFFGPIAMGVIKDQTGSNLGGLFLLGGCYVGVAVLAFVVPKPTKLE
ncbi:MAG TPA: MFS transporter [Verrucomicrobiae bacterium]|nr:MFS transporter [Verrucomicrobiae bacterium]